MEMLKLPNHSTTVLHLQFWPLERIMICATMFNHFLHVIWFLLIDVVGAIPWIQKIEWQIMSVMHKWHIIFEWTNKNNPISPSIVMSQRWGNELKKLQVYTINKEVYFIFITGFLENPCGFHLNSKLFIHTVTIILQDKVFAFSMKF